MQGKTQQQFSVVVAAAAAAENGHWHPSHERWRATFEEEGCVFLLSDQRN